MQNLHSVDPIDVKIVASCLLLSAFIIGISEANDKGIIQFDTFLRNLRNDQLALRRNTGITTVSLEC